MSEPSLSIARRLVGEGRNRPAPPELLLDILPTAEGQLQVSPRGLRDEPPPFLMAPIFGRPPERAGLVPSPEALGLSYYEALFARQPALRAWLDACIEARGGRLVFIEGPGTPFELWETLATPNHKQLLLQGISIERRLGQIEAAPPASGPLPESLRVLWVAPTKKPNAEDSGARRIVRLFGQDELVDCKPPTLQKMMELLAKARHEGPRFQVLHLEGRSFLEFHGGKTSALYFEPSHGGAIKVDFEQLRDCMGGLPLVILEDDSRLAAGARPAALDVVPYLHELGVPSVIVAPFPKQTDQASRFIDRFYDELRIGKSIGESVNAGRRALLTDPEHRAAESGAGSLRGWWSVQLYQQGADAELVQARSFGAGSGRHAVPEPVAAAGAMAAPSQVSTQPTLASTAGVSPAPVQKIFRRPLIAAGLVLALLGGAALIGRHVQESRQRQSAAAEASRLQKERMEKNARVEQAVASCFNPNPFQCTTALQLSEECYRERFPELWPKCSFWIGRIKEGGLAGKREPGVARDAYEQACAGGHALACLDLGYMKEHGAGLLQAERLEARADYERGCQMNNQEACANAARLYATDDPEHGLHPNWQKVQALYAKSCGTDRSGIPSGCVGLGTVLWEQQHDTRSAYDLFSRACNQGDLMGCARLGELTKNPAEREQLFRRACGSLDGNQLGSCSGCLPLAESYREAAGKEQAAFALYQDLCPAVCARREDGAHSCCEDPEVQGPACRWLGWIWSYGKLKHPINRKQAKAAWQRGCASGDPLSCKYLEQD